MSLEPGQPLLHYRLVEKIGEGGMGEVWRASDSTLGRDVAIKVLPAGFAGEPERMARFEREARLLAALNHSGIAAIYGLHEADGVRFLALELVEGDDLSQRLRLGPIPVDEALSLALRIAEALEYAHEHGIVHRDLKPANVKVTPDGEVKVLDFGLAKAITEDSAAPESGSSPTLMPTVTSGGTAAGLILGTAAYMSPEQARGKAVDKRTDIWAFGCLLYEMLVGERLFAGENVSDTIAAVLTLQPDWSALPASLPAPIRTLLSRCLERDSRQRLRDIGEARVTLGGDPASETTAVHGPAGRRGLSSRVVLAVAAVVSIAGFFAGRWYDAVAPERGSRRDRRNVVADVVAPEGGKWSLDGAGPGAVAVSPDGRRLAFSVQQAGRIRLWVRALDSPQAHVIPESEGAQYPFWSPDSGKVGFFARGRLWISDLDEPRPEPLAPAQDGKGGSWSPDGVIVYTPNANEPLFRFEVATGTNEPLTSLTELGHSSHRHPRFLADGRRFLFMARGENDSENRVMLGSLAGDTPREILRNPGQAELVGDRLLWVENGALCSRRVSADTLEFLGRRETVARGVLEIVGAAYAAFSASPDTLAFHRGTSSRNVQLVWVEPSGDRRPAFEPLAGLQHYRLAPDGRHVVVNILDPMTNSTDLWVLDLARGIRTRVTSDAGPEYQVVWAAYGDSLIYAAGGTGNYNSLYRRPLRGGQETALLESEDDLSPEDVSRDGNWLLYRSYQSKSGSDLYVLSLAGDGERRPVATTPFLEQMGRFSPDGRWVSFLSNESGRWELFVAPFPALDRKWQVSRDGAYPHAWAPDSRSLFYNFASSATFEVGIRGGPEPRFETPRLALQIPRGTVGNISGLMEMAPDGRILAVEGDASEDRTRLSLLLDWAD